MPRIFSTQLMLLIGTAVFLTACSKDKAGNSDTLPPTTVSTIAGNGTSGFVDANGQNARFNWLASIAVDGSGNLYVADVTNYSIRKVSTNGTVTTLAGGSMGTADGNGPAAQFMNPVGVTVDASGTVYVADLTRVRKITPAGEVSTLAGTTQYAVVDGTGTSARFNSIRAIRADHSGNIYVIDNGADFSLIRRITSSGVVTTLAGGAPGKADGTGSAARFSTPMALTTDAQGNIFVLDQAFAILENYVRKVTPGGVVTTIGKTPPASGLAADGNGYLYFSGVTTNLTDSWIYVYRMNASGSYAKYSGKGTIGYADGQGGEAMFSGINDLVSDAGGQLYVAEQARIRKISK